MSTNHSSPWFLWGQRAIVLIEWENSLKHYRTLGINLFALLPMPTLAPTHTPNCQLECQRRKTTPIVLTLLLLLSMTIPVMATDTTFVEEQLIEMARAIAKLTKTVEEKDMQIASLINKVKTQVQKTSESSQ